MTDLERSLRGMMDERAGDISVLPESLRTLDGSELPSSHGQGRGRVRRMLLVAAVVALVAAISFGVAQLVGRKSPPATHLTPVPTGLHSYCPGTLPASWPRTGGLAVSGADSPRLLAVAPDGDALASRHVGATRDVALLHDGFARRIFTIANPAADRAVAAGFDGNWALVVTMQYPWNDKFQVIELDLINLRTAERRVVARTAPADIGTGKNAIIGGTITGGRVYWGLGAWPRFTTLKVQIYDIATGKTTTDPRSTAPGNPATSPPVANVFAVTYQTKHGSVAVPNALPPAVATAVHSAGSIARSTLVTDGVAYAWANSRGHLGWWRPGQAAVTIYREPYAARPDGLLVAGTYLIFGAQDGSTMVMDVRTGAAARTPAGVKYAGASSAVLWSYTQEIALGSSGNLATNQIASLPELLCT